MNKNLTIILLFIFQNQLWAQDVEFTVSAPRVVQIGERFQIIYRLNAKGSDVQFPDFKGLSVQGPSTQTSSSVEIVNGRMKQSYSFGYVFYAVASKKGEYNLEPATAKVDGKLVQSNKLAIEAIGEAPENETEPGQPSGAVEGNKEVFATISLSKGQAYVGEGIIATLKFYTRVNLVDVSNLKVPAFAGFWVQDVFSPNQINLERENVNGAIYNAAVIKKVLLFPQKTGKLNIEAFELDVVKGRPSFFGMQAAGELKLVSNQINVDVRDLPLPKPEAFNGAVGQFSMQKKIDQNKIKANDAIKYDITISGVGNLNLLSEPKPQFPSQFEVFDPKVSENIKSTEGGQSGTKTFQYLLIPRSAGTFVIPGVVFSYFDVASKSYKTIKTAEDTVYVEEGEEQPAAIINQTGVVKSEVDVLNSDILFIKENAPDFKLKDQFFIASLNYFLLLGAPFTLFFILIILLRKRAKEMADVSKMRTKKAGKVSRKRLKEAKLLINSDKKEPFYAAINQALVGFLADKLSIPTSDIKRDYLKERLAQKNIDNSIVENYMQLIDKCEFARYAPAQVNDSFTDIYKTASEIIDQLDKKL